MDFAFDGKHIAKQHWDIVKQTKKTPKNTTTLLRTKPKNIKHEKKISCWKSILHPLTVTARVCTWGPLSLHPLLCRSPQRSVQLQVWTGAQAVQQGWEEGAAEDRRLALAMQLNLSCILTSSISFILLSTLFHQVYQDGYTWLWRVHLIEEFLLCWKVASQNTFLPAPISRKDS